MSQRFDELSKMLIKRFQQEQVEILGRKENRVGLFEIFFNGESVYSKVRIIVNHLNQITLKLSYNFFRKNQERFQILKPSLLLQKEACMICNRR